MTDDDWREDLYRGMLAGGWKPKRPRGTAPRRAHDSHAWEQRAKAFLQANPYCILCRAIGLPPTRATIADHVHPVSDGADMLTSELQPLCAVHHQSVKRRLEGLFARGQCTPADLRCTSALAIRLAEDGPLPFEWRGCDRNGMPKDPRHPWHRKR